MQDFGRLLRRGHIFGAHNPPERIGIKLFAHHHLADISRRAPGLPDIFPHPSFIISPANIISDDRCAMCGVKGFCPLIACQPAASRETKGAIFVILAADDLHALHFAVQRRKGGQNKKVRIVDRPLCFIAGGSVNEGFTRGHHKDSQRQHEEFVHIKKGKNRLRVLVFLRNKAKNTRRQPMTQAGRSIFRFRSFFIRRGSIRAGR